MQVYQIKITIEESKPAIWRRVLVSPEELLYDLHYVIQAVVGWEDSHQHQFIKDKKYYIEKQEGDEEWDDTNCVDYNEMTIRDLLKKESDKMRYEYDFGDGWMHEVLLEKIIEADDKGEYPICIDGEQNCPPEDCGGMPGYYHLLDVLTKKDHAEYDETVEWLGDDFDQAFFSVDESNEVLREVF